MQNCRFGRSAIIFCIAQFAIASFGWASNTPVADGLGRTCMELVREGRIAEALKLCDPSTLPDGASEALRQTQELMPKGSAVTIELVSNKYFKTFPSSRLDEQLTYHMKDGSRAALIMVSARTEGSKTLLTGFRVEPAPLNLRDRFPFKLSGMSGLHYLFLTLAVLIPAFIIVSAVACIRSGIHRRWLWTIFMLVGIGKASIVWTGSDSLDAPLIFNQLLYVQVLGAGVAKYPIYDPWIISISFPLGAILFWRKVRLDRMGKNEEGHPTTG